MHSLNSRFCKKIKKQIFKKKKIPSQYATLLDWCGAEKTGPSNTYYEIFRVSSWAFAAYIIALISAQPT